MVVVMIITIQLERDCVPSRERQVVIWFLGVVLFKCFYFVCQIHISSSIVVLIYCLYFPLIMTNKQVDKNKAEKLTSHKYKDGTREEWHYNNAGILTSYKYPDGTTTEWHYNKAGKLTLRKYRDGTIAEYKYNKAGQLTLCKYKDGTTEEWHYNNAGKLTLWKETNNTYWIDEKPYRKEEK